VVVALAMGGSQVLERERYLFDVRGYIVVRSVLSATDIDELRDEIRAAGIEEALGGGGYLHVGFPHDYYDTANRTGELGYRYACGSFILDWGAKIRSLVAHPRLLPYLSALVGPEFRLDHAYGVFSRGRTDSHALHNGGTPFDPTQMYLCREGRLYNSMVAVQFALSGVTSGDGGFCCIPGSHKANFPLPMALASLDDQDGDGRAAVCQVALGPGDALIFTEALTHGALGWNGAGDRMALLFKYTHGAMQWERKSPFVSPGHPWNPVEQMVLTGPYAGGRVPVAVPEPG
jgi:hypothetical protein